MDTTIVAIITAVGAIFTGLVVVFLKLFRDLIVKIIPDGFELLRRQMEHAEETADERHDEHIAHMTRIEDTLERQEGRKRQRIAARVRRRGREPRKKPAKAKKPRQQAS